jgi:hypothetical protein
MLIRRRDAGHISPTDLEESMEDNSASFLGLIHNFHFLLLKISYYSAMHFSIPRFVSDDFQNRYISLVLD